MCSLFVGIMIVDFGGDSDLHIKATVVMIRDDMMIFEPIFTLRVENTALTVAIKPDILLTDLTDSISLCGIGVDVENRVGGISMVGAGDSGATGGRVGTGVRSSENATSNKRTTNRKDDTHSHCGGENSSHAEEGFRVRDVLQG